MWICLKLLVKFLLENGHRVCSSQSCGRKKGAAAVEPDAGRSNRPNSEWVTGSSLSKVGKWCGGGF